jgi:hypothetical protein
MAKIIMTCKVQSQRLPLRCHELYGRLVHLLQAVSRSVGSTVEFQAGKSNIHITLIVGVILSSARFYPKLIASACFSAREMLGVEVGGTDTTGQSEGDRGESKSVISLLINKFSGVCYV